MQSQSVSHFSIKSIDVQYSNTKERTKRSNRRLSLNLGSCSSCDFKSVWILLNSPDLPRVTNPGNLEVELFHKSRYLLWPFNDLEVRITSTPWFQREKKISFSTAKLHTLLRLTILNHILRERYTRFILFPKRIVKADRVIVLVPEGTSETGLLVSELVVCCLQHDSLVICKNEHPWTIHAAAVWGPISVLNRLVRSSQILNWLSRL